jgi:hypothetical protein
MRNYILFTNFFGTPMYVELCPLSGFKLCNDKKQAEIFSNILTARSKAEELSKVSGCIMEIEQLKG